ncbi:MAG: M23 family metallopeptidase, partial [Jiangellaceae bacterium]
ITSPYGMRRHPITGVYKLHSGTDFAPGDGVARAARAGTVVGAGNEGAYGTMVTLSHGAIDGAEVVTRYAHLSSAGVSVGQQVAAGAALGQIGSTGSSTGRHLHFEVLVNGEFVDPMTWLD